MAVMVMRNNNNQTDVMCYVMEIIEGTKGSETKIMKGE